MKHTVMLALCGLLVLTQSFPIIAACPKFEAPYNEQDQGRPNILRAEDNNPGQEVVDFTSHGAYKFSMISSVSIMRYQ